MNPTKLFRLYLKQNLMEVFEFFLQFKMIYSTKSISRNTTRSENFIVDHTFKQTVDNYETIQRFIKRFLEWNFKPTHNTNFNESILIYKPFTNSQSHEQQETEIHTLFSLLYSVI